MGNTELMSHLWLSARFAMALGNALSQTSSVENMVLKVYPLAVSSGLSVHWFSVSFHLPTPVITLLLQARFAVLKDL